MMDRNKLHLIACYIASICVDESYIRCKEAHDNGDTLSLLSDPIIKRGLIMASIPVIKDKDVINEVKEDNYFKESFKVQIATLLKSTKFYN